MKTKALFLFLFALLTGSARAQTQTNTWTGTHIFKGGITAPSFRKLGGTSTQFLKADGTTDTTSYASRYGFKTINGQNIYGTGNLSIASGSGGGDAYLDSTQTWTGTNTFGAINASYGRIITGFPGTGLIENNYGLDYINLISQVNAYNNYSALFAAYGINRYGSYLAFIKSRTWDGNTYNRVVNGDEIMMLESTVDVGSYLSTKARIATYVDGTPAGDFCPARIEMWTAPAGGYITKRLTIFNDGNVAINNSANAGYKLDVNGTVRLSDNTDISGSLAVSDASTPAIPTAKVAINSTSKGFLTPRMTSGQRDLILSPEEGLEIYNLTTHSKEFWNGTVWKTITTN